MLIVSSVDTTESHYSHELDTAVWLTSATFDCRLIGVIIQCGHKN